MHVAEIHRLRGRQFDPDIVDGFDLVDLGDFTEGVEHPGTPTRTTVPTPGGLALVRRPASAKGMLRPGPATHPHFSGEGKVRAAKRCPDPATTYVRRPTVGTF